MTKTTKMKLVKKLSLFFIPMFLFYIFSSGQIYISLDVEDNELQEISNSTKVRNFLSKIISKV